MKNYNWQYVGDLNPENGGYWFNLSGKKWGYIDVIRVTPASDAGLADNVFWIEDLTVNLPKSTEEKNRVLSICGLTIEDLKPGKLGFLTLIDSCIAYGQFDAHPLETLQIGPKCQFTDSRKYENLGDVHQIRANCKLKNYIKKNYLSRAQGV